MPERNLLIKDLIRQIHKELLDSQVERESEGMKPLFKVETLVIEANFVAIDDQQAEAGFGFCLLKAGGKVNYKKEQIHKITLNLSALGNDRGLSRKHNENDEQIKELLNKIEGLHGGMAPSVAG